jgi:hypothetical protein
MTKASSCRRDVASTASTPLPGRAALDRLGIALYDHDTVSAYTVSVNAREGTTLGISAADRARTVRVLADSTAGPSALTRPGHVFPMRYRKFGVSAFSYTEQFTFSIRVCSVGSKPVHRPVYTE